MCELCRRRFIRGAAALGVAGALTDPKLELFTATTPAVKLAEKLAELARRTGLHVIAPTGLHHERFYGPAHWSQQVTVDELAGLFEDE